MLRSHEIIGTPLSAYIALSLLIFLILFANLPKNALAIDIYAHAFYGRLADPEDIKFLANIRHRDWQSEPLRGRCIGALISPQAVLTAAHCFIIKPNVTEIENWVVVLNTKPIATVYDIKEIAYPGPGYDSRTCEKDIAIIFLNSIVPAETLGVQTIDVRRGLLPVAAPCRLYGIHFFFSETQNRTLLAEVREADVLHLFNSDCEKKDLVAKGEMRPGVLCAGDRFRRAGPCSVSPGALLVCHGKLTGILTTVSGCKKPKNYAVYADILYYKDWILEKIYSCGDQEMTYEE